MVIYNVSVLELEDYLHCDMGVQMFGCLEFTRIAVQINSFSTGIRDEFGAFTG